MPSIVPITGQIPPMCPPDRLSPDAYDGHPQIPPHFSRAPRLEPLQRNHPYEKQATEIYERCTALYTTHNLTRPHGTHEYRMGLVYAGTWQELEDPDRDRTMFLLFEMSPADIRDGKWRLAEVGLKAMLRDTGMSGLHGVCYRIYEDTRERAVPFPVLERQSTAPTIVASPEQYGSDVDFGVGETWDVEAEDGATLYEDLPVLIDANGRAGGEEEAVADWENHISDNEQHPVRPREGHIVLVDGPVSENPWTNLRRQTRSTRSGSGEILMALRISPAPVGLAHPAVPAGLTAWVDGSNEELPPFWGVGARRTHRRLGIANSGSSSLSRPPPSWSTTETATGGASSALVATQIMAQFEAPFIDYTAPRLRLTTSVPRRQVADPEPPFWLVAVLPQRTRNARAANPDTAYSARAIDNWWDSPPLYSPAGHSPASRPAPSTAHATTASAASSSAERHAPGPSSVQPAEGYFARRVRSHRERAAQIPEGESSQVPLLRELQMERDVLQNPHLPPGVPPGEEEYYDDEEEHPDDGDHGPDYEPAEGEYDPVYFTSPPPPPPRPHHSRSARAHDDGSHASVVRMYGALRDVLGRTRSPQTPLRRHAHPNGAQPAEAAVATLPDSAQRDGRERPAQDTRSLRTLSTVTLPSRPIPASRRAQTLAHREGQASVGRTLWAVPADGFEPVPTNRRVEAPSVEAVHPSGSQATLTLFEPDGGGGDSQARVHSQRPQTRRTSLSARLTIAQQVAIFAAIAARPETRDVPTNEQQSESAAESAADGEYDSQYDNESGSQEEESSDEESESEITRARECQRVLHLRAFGSPRPLPPPPAIERV